jgi:hypothetical protein
MPLGQSISLAQRYPIDEMSTHLIIIRNGAKKSSMTFEVLDLLFVLFSSRHRTKGAEIPALLCFGIRFS